MKKFISLMSLIIGLFGVAGAYEHISIDEYKNCQKVKEGLYELQFYIEKVESGIPIYSGPYWEENRYIIEYDINELYAQYSELQAVKLECDIIEVNKEDKELEEHISEDWRDARNHLSSFTIEILDSLVPIFKAKDQKTQDNVNALLKTFESSKDNYTRNIGIYFRYLINQK